MESTATMSPPPFPPSRVPQYPYPTAQVLPPEEPAALPPLAALRRRWIVGLLLALIGLAVGIEAGNSRPVTYTAQASLAVGGQDLSSFQVAGFALAAEQIASNYARYVGLPQSQATFRKVLGASATQVRSVAGSPISNSNIILVEVVATNRAVAIAASNAIAAELMQQANAPNVLNTAAVYLSQYQQISHELYNAQAVQVAAQLRLATMTGHHATATALAIQQNVVNGVATRVATLLVQQKTLEAQYTNALTNATTYSRLVSAQTAVVTLVSRKSTLERYGLAGLVLGAGLGLAMAVLLDRLSVRRRIRRLRTRAALRQRPAAVPTSSYAKALHAEQLRVDEARAKESRTRALRDHDLSAGGAPISGADLAGADGDAADDPAGGVGGADGEPGTGSDQKGSDLEDGESGDEAVSDSQRLLNR